MAVPMYPVSEVSVLHLRWSTLPFLCLASFVLYAVFNRYGRGVNSIPGPFLASLTSWWKFFIVWREEWPWQNVALHERYGPLVRIGPYHISAASMEALNAVSVHKKGFKKVKHLLTFLWQH